MGNESSSSTTPHGIIFTTISNPGDDKTLNLTSIFKLGSYIALNKAKSFSSYYPSYYMVMLGKTYNDLNLFINHVVTENRVFEKMPLHPFKLENMREAHLQMESQRTVGKIVIDIN